ncbi:hypothetical protein FQA47_008905 [Oryzias melastigma]|uniref:Uncharacterized protein n=1 Tax=Oryzias melastigma TaxID=30732 RepID=A0A834BRJ0_ORYME|nr:hypothetical protein FQA47_008905 [Oryzias melastigma]
MITRFLKTDSPPKPIIICQKPAQAELQDLERSNSAFQKEIAELKKDLIFYQMTLKRHKPYCRLTASSPSSPSSPSSCCSRSPTYHQASSSPPQASNCPSPAMQATDLTVRTPSPSAPSSISTAANMFQSPSSSCLSSPVNPTSLSAASPSDFTKLPPTPLNLSNKPSVSPNPIPYTASQSPGMSSSIASFTDYVLAKLDASLAASPKTQVPLAIEAKNTRAIKQDFSLSYPRGLSGSHSSLSWPFGLIPPSYQASSGQTIQTPLPPFAWKQSPQASLKSLHSLLSGPSPLNIYQANSSLPSLSFSQMQATVPDPSQDLSLSELLEFNDWILSGPANQ